MDFTFFQIHSSLIIPAVVVALLILVMFLLIHRIKKEKGFLMRGINLKLFLVQIPQEFDKEKEKPFSLEEYLKNAEQFFSSLSGINELSMMKRILLGNPFLVFEISVHRIGEQIYFYIACPRNLAQQVEKQILAFWPKAMIQETSDYNIFNPEGYSIASTAKLSKNPVFPLKPYQELATDPLSSITSIFTKLSREGEGASIQILFRPSRKSIKILAQKAIKFMQEGKSAEQALNMAKSSSGVMGALKPEKKDNKEEISRMPSNPSPLIQNQMAAISQKSISSLFDVNLRVLSSAQTKERAAEVLEQIHSSFEQISSLSLNQIKFRKKTGRNLKRLFYNFSFRIFNEAESVLLSSGELASIFHFPAPHLLTPHIKWLKAKQAPAPDNLPKEGIIIGKNVFRGEERVVPILRKDRRRHFYVIGQTGTGKSVLLQEMIAQDIKNNEGVALIDPHGDIAENVLELVPANRMEDVIYFNPGDYEMPLGLNMLEFDPNYPESKTFVVNEILEIFEKLYNLQAHGFGGPVFEQYMRNSLLLIMEDPESGNTLIEIPKVLADANFRKYKLSKCKNPIVKNFWEQEAEKAGGEAALANMVPYITSKMNVFIANDFVRPIISQPKSTLNFRKIMDEGKILIINLSKGKLGDVNSFLLGMIVVGKILIAAFSRVDLPEDKRKDFNLYIDEFQNVTTKTMSTVLAEARKYRLAMIFAHQYIGQLDENTQKAVFGNVGSMLTFRVGPDDAKYLANQFEPVFSENDLVNLDNYNAALRLLINGETSKPFNILTYPPSDGNKEIAKLIKEYSRLKYGKDRRLVESELHERVSKIY